MNWNAPFLASDLEELDTRLLSLAERVVPMRDIAKGDRSPAVIGLRHDVDDNEGSFETALRIAEWEFEHGYSSTYFLLHGSHYWNEDMLCRAPIFAELGHEVGIHVNAIAEGLRQSRNPHDILDEALTELRAAVHVVGCVAHGDQLCHQAGFVNDEMFLECRRDKYGPADRILSYRSVRLRLVPGSLRWHGLEYDANWLPRGCYLSDSGGSWSQDIRAVEQVLGWKSGQLHILWHPDWWADAFAQVTA